jgi:hypothetical protein
VLTGTCRARLLTWLLDVLGVAVGLWDEAGGSSTRFLI